MRKSLIAIPFVNGARLLERLLPTLNITKDMIVVLDQGSTESSEAVCRAEGVGFVQLGHPNTYTEACNVSAALARSRDCAFLFVSNNDIRFTTDVVRELVSEMIADEWNCRSGAIDY